jgi:hypothetical protein
VVLTSRPRKALHAAVGVVSAGGMAGLSSSWDAVQFDNFKLASTNSSSPSPSSF